MKSDHGLKARSGATQMQISYALYDLNAARAYGLITFAEWERQYKELKRQGKIKGR